MNSGLVLAIDQGTTNTKALAFDAAGKVVASASVRDGGHLSTSGLGRAVGA